MEIFIGPVGRGSGLLVRLIQADDGASPPLRHRAHSLPTIRHVPPFQLVCIQKLYFSPSAVRVVGVVVKCNNRHIGGAGLFMVSQFYPPMHHALAS
jgi:hypothetical protein